MHSICAKEEGSRSLSFRPPPCAACRLLMHGCRLHNVGQYAVALRATMRGLQEKGVGPRAGWSRRCLRTGARQHAWGAGAARPGEWGRQPLRARRMCFACLHAPRPCSCSRVKRPGVWSCSSCGKGWMRILLPYQRTCSRSACQGQRRRRGVVRRARRQALQEGRFVL